VADETPLKDALPASSMELHSYTDNNGWIFEELKIKDSDSCAHARELLQLECVHDRMVRGSNQHRKSASTTPYYSPLPTGSLALQVLARRHNTQNTHTKKTKLDMNHVACKRVALL
jgi:hypothetical protein